MSYRAHSRAQPTGGDGGAGRDGGGAASHPPAALEGSLLDGAVDVAETRSLARLREKLDLTREDHDRSERRVRGAFDASPGARVAAAD